MKKLFTLALVSILCTLGLDSYAQNFKTAVASGKDSYIELQGNYDLGGATVKIPDNCTLFFKGGKVTNGTIDFNGCKILGDPTFLCNVTGDVANDFVDLGWFGLVKGDTADNGPTINKVAKVFNRLKLPHGTYYFSTPIVLPDVKFLEFYGDLKYTGKKNTSAISVTGTTAIMNFNGTISCYGNKNLSYLDGSKNSNIVGLDFVNVNNSTILVNSVICFNENVRISGLGAGCCYNKFTFGLIRNSNTGLRIYSGVKDGKTGWAHENIFIGGRFANLGTWDYDKQPSYAVRIEGETADRPANSLFFLKQSFERYRTIVYARNLKKSVFLNCRVEQSDLFVKFVGECKNNEISTGYNDDCVLYDDSESTLVARDVNDQLQTLIADIDKASSQTLKSGKTEMQVIDIDTRAGKTIKVVADSPVKVGIVYKTKNGTNQITDAENQKMSAPRSNLTTTAIQYNSTYHHFENRSKRESVVFSVPSDVTSIQIRVYGTYSYAHVYGIGGSAAVMAK